MSTGLGREDIRALLDDLSATDRMDIISAYRRRRPIVTEL
jgi:hypothetical protein